MFLYFRKKLNKKATGLIMERILSQDLFLKAVQQVGVDHPDLKDLTEKIIEKALEKIAGKLPYLDEFEKSCNKHTLCYQCVSKRNFSTRRPTTPGYG